MGRALGQILQRLAMLAVVWILLVSPGWTTGPSAPAGMLVKWADRHFLVRGAEQGFPHDGIYSLAQDGQGFLWVGTVGGLARWDGTRALAFAHDADKPESLPDNTIRTLLADAQGGLWLGTDAHGIIHFDTKTEVFSPIAGVSERWQRTKVFHLAPDPAGGLWAAAQGGLGHWSATDGWSATPVGDPTDPVFTVLADPDGTVWAGTPTGLYRRLPGAVEFLPVRMADDSVSPSIWSIYRDRAGRLWVGTDGGGVLVLGPERPGAGPPGSANPLLRSPGAWADPQGPIGRSTVRAFAEATDGRLWIATYGSGAIVVDVSDGSYTAERRDPLRPGSLPDNFVRDILFDHSGMMWLATERGLAGTDAAITGVSVVSASPVRKSGLHGDEPSAMIQGPDGRIWAGFGDGRIEVVEPDGEVREVGGEAGPALPREVTALASLPDGDVLAGSMGLYRINGQRLTLAPIANPGFQRMLVLGIATDRDGQTVWIASYTGLTQLDLKTGTTRLYRTSQTDMNTIPDDDVRDVLVEGPDRVWVSTRRGLALINPTTGRTRRFQHDPADPTSIPVEDTYRLSLDHRHRIWISGNAAGLMRITPVGSDGYHFDRIDHRNGMPSDDVLAAVDGAGGFLWIATTGGIARVDPDTLVIRRYDRVSIIPPPGVRSYRVGTALADGSVVLPARGALVVIGPRGIDLPPETAPLTLTGVRLGGRAVPASSPLHLTKALPSRSLEIDYGLLDLAAPETVRYAYWLDGLMPTWSELTGERRPAAFTALPPGQYQLHLRAVPDHGTGEPIERVWPVVVEPRWNETGWWHAILALAALVGVGLVVQARTLVLRNRQRWLSAQIEARTRALNASLAELRAANSELSLTQAKLVQQEKLASLGRLVAGLAHELNTPLGVALSASSTLTVRANELAVAVEDGKLTRKMLSQTANHTGQLAVLIEQATIKASDLVRRFKLLAAEDQRGIAPIALVDRIRTVRAGALETLTGAEVVIEGPADLVIGTYGQAIDQVMRELLENAIRHGAVPGRSIRITITVTPSADGAVVSVADDGAGMTPEILAQAFEPFFTTRRAAGGVGLGLQIAKILATGPLKGDLTLTSGAGIGTVATLRLADQSMAAA